MKITKNIALATEHGKPVLIDLFYQKNNQKKKIVFFCHGYKGYKDWGAWNLVAQEFAKNNFFFVKMNFSHNGGTIQEPIDFPDLDAFGKNNFSLELNDLQVLMKWIHEDNDLSKELDLRSISLIGHSRGAGTALVKASEDDRITNVISWGGVSDFKSRFPAGPVLEEWKDKGVVYIDNARTKQKMPHYIQFYEDFMRNEERYNIKSSVQKLKIPYLIIHGSNDETVSLDEAKNLFKWNPNNQILIIENGTHTFGSSQPWDKDTMPADLKDAVDHTINFIL